MKNCIVWGGTGQAKMLRPMLERDGYRITAIFDNNPDLTPPFADIPLEGGWQDFVRKRASLGDNLSFAVAIGGGFGRDRFDIASKLKGMGLAPITLIHESAHVGATAVIGEGSQIMPMAAVCEEAKIGPYCIVNTNAGVDHESTIGCGVHVMPGATIAGSVRVGDFCTIGSNATVLPRIKIAEGAFIGAGAVVTKDVKQNAVIVGVPGRPRPARAAKRSK